MSDRHLFSVPSRLDLSYEELRDRAVAALAGGDHQAASQLFDWAYVRARQLEDADLVDRAVCNRAALAVEFGRSDSLIPELQRIARAVADPELRFLAAYNLARISTFKNRRSEAKAFARQAYRVAKRAGSNGSVATSTYQLGLENLKEGHYSRARRHCVEAVEIFSDLPHRREEAALVASSLGYCLSLEGRLKESRSALDQSVALAKTSLSEIYTMDMRLNFGFTFLNSEEYEAADEFAQQVLSKDCHRVEYKHALYLAGGANACRGRLDDAEYYFQLLQSEFYSDQPTVVDLLLAYPTHQLVSWLS